MNSPGPLISLVINYFNPRALTRLEAIAIMCLESIHGGTRNRFEVILSDGSGVESIRVKDACERLGLTYLLCPVPKNFEAIYNQGLALARGQYCAMLEYDVFPVNNWDVRILGEMQRTGANIALPYLSSCDNHSQQTGFVVRHYTFEPSGMSHNFVVMDRQALSVLYPLDEQFNATCNDNDMYMRARSAGLRIIVCDAGGMVHYRGASEAYAPWTFSEDHEKFKAKYPQLNYWDRYGLYDFFTPTFCRSRLYRCMARIVAAIPHRRVSTYLLNHLTRIEPIMHRI